MGRLRPGQWNLFCKADDSRVHKDAEIDVGEVILESLFQLLLKGNSVLH